MLGTKPSLSEAITASVFYFLKADTPLHLGAPQYCSTATNALCNINYLQRCLCTTSHPVRRESTEFLIIKSDGYDTSRIRILKFAPHCTLETFYAGLARANFMSFAATAPLRLAESR